MQVKMIQTATGSPNGINVQKYSVGEPYDIPDSLAKVFLEMGVAHEYTPVKRTITEKKADAPTENKMLSPDENKKAKGKK